MWFVWVYSCEEVSLAVSAAAERARAAVSEQEQRLLDDLSSARTNTTRQLDNHIAASHLHVCCQQPAWLNG